jgi:hypothetical protein
VGETCCVRSRCSRLTLCRPRRLSHCVSPTVSPSPCLPLYRPHCLSHCVSLAVSCTCGASRRSGITARRRGRLNLRAHHVHQTLRRPHAAAVHALQCVRRCLHGCRTHSPTGRISPTASRSPQLRNGCRFHRRANVRSRVEIARSWEPGVGTGVSARECVDERRGMGSNAFTLRPNHAVL